MTSLPLIALIPILGALLPLWLARRGRLGPAWSAAAVTIATALPALVPAQRVFEGELILAHWPWLPEFGLNAAFRFDGLGLLFTILVLGIGLLVILYSRYYLSKDDALGRFYSYLLLFMGSMLGIVIADNLLLLLVFWEMTSLSSFLLIGYWSDRAGSRQAARMSLIITGSGGLALLAGFLLLGHMAGSFELSEILGRGERIREHSLYLPMLLLILIGAFTKSAQFPFHIWLPRAMEAPTPVSAYLHSAAMVKAGVFLLARLFPALSGTDAWFLLVSSVGTASLLFGAYTALFKHDLKGLLAYSTISHLGLITLLLGLNSPLGAVAGVFHIINHAIFKASLFMAAGIIDHETGSRDMRRINGLFKYMPHTAVLAMVAAASMAGVPLLNGFLSKEMFFSATLQNNHAGTWTWLEPTAAVLYGVFSVAYSARFIHDVFFNGEPVGLSRVPHEPERWMKIPVEILVGLVLLVGVAPAFTVGPLLERAVLSVVPGELPEYTLTVWHGVTPAFMMSLFALGGGVLLYTQRARLFALHDRVFPRFSGTALFENLLNLLTRAARPPIAWLETGSLQNYVLLLVLATLVLALAGAAPDLPLDTQTLGQALADVRTADPISLVAALVLIAGAAGAAVWHRKRLQALILLSVVGLVVSLAFVRFSAPDLALTQLSVELVTIVLLLLALYFLPQQTGPESSSWRRARDVSLAVAAGLGVTGLTLAVLNAPFQSISDFYLQQSVPEGGGHNVVNVILVDFRGFDTLGEITVLACAAIGIHAMLERVNLYNLEHLKTRAVAEDRYPMILSVLTRPLLPVALLVSIFLFLRGHNHPGGGFVGGLLISIALLLQYIASGGEWTRERIHLNYHGLVATGVGLATAVGLGGLVFASPFLSQTFWHLHLPWIGDLELATALLFDLGVYLTVVGAVMLILADLGQLGQRPVTVQMEAERSLP